MKTIGKYFLCMITVLMIAGTGCPGGKDAASGTSESPHKEKTGGFLVPVEGTPSERVKKLWETTGPVMKADARANLGDGEYQKKRPALFSAWVRLSASRSISAS